MAAVVWKLIKMGLYVTIPLVWIIIGYVLCIIKFAIWIERVLAFSVRVGGNATN